jgi:hypothetical protein
VLVQVAVRAQGGSIRLLERDAQWLFDWGDSWVLDVSRTRVLKAGTPVFIVGEYDFDAAPPWRSLNWLSQQVELPSAPIAEPETAAMSPSTPPWRRAPLSLSGAATAPLSMLCMRDAKIGTSSKEWQLRRRFHSPGCGLRHPSPC